MIHYGQGIRSNEFRQFDHGSRENRRQYGTTTPPQYQLSNIRAPVALHYSHNDWLAATVDVERLAAKLTNVIELHLVGHEHFTHLDFLWSTAAKSLVYNKVRTLMTRAEAQHLADSREIDESTE